RQELLNILRFSISFLVLLLPTTAMGLTLPVLLEEPLLYRRQFGRVIGAFYGFNTLGAVAGALVGEGYLIQKFGLPGTGLTAACVSLAASAIRFATPRKILPILSLLAAIGTLLSYVFFPVPALLGDSKDFHIESWPEIARLSFALMFPVAFLSGIVLPLIATCVQEE